MHLETHLTISPIVALVYPPKLEERPRLQRETVDAWRILAVLLKAVKQLGAHEVASQRESDAELPYFLMNSDFKAQPALSRPSGFFVRSCPRPHNFHARCMGVVVLQPQAPHANDSMVHNIQIRIQYMVLVFSLNTLNSLICPGPTCCESSVGSDHARISSFGSPSLQDMPIMTVY